jgi:hypothetical protein
MGVTRKYRKGLSQSGHLAAFLINGNEQGRLAAASRTVLDRSAQIFYLNG